MPKEVTTPKDQSEAKDKVEIEALSDEALEDVSGGMCSYAACSNKD